MLAVLIYKMFILDLIILFMVVKSSNNGFSLLDNVCRRDFIFRNYFSIIIFDHFRQNCYSFTHYH